MIYFDASALVKLALDEAESPALRAWLANWPELRHITSDLSRVEVARSVMRTKPSALLVARRVLARTTKIAFDDAAFDTAAALQPPELRSLDALHLAAALSVRQRMTAFITYDKRLFDAAQAARLPVEQPS